MSINVTKVKMIKSVALIMAAGSGTRLAAGMRENIHEMPKQYLLINQQSVLSYSILSFLDHADIAALQIVIRAGDEMLYRETMAFIAHHPQFSKILPPVLGGAERQDSVRHGLKSLAQLRPDYVLIHDAARPGVDGAMITHLLAACKDGDGAIPALPIADTIKRGAHDMYCGETLPRDGLYLAQTPQIFNYKSIQAAHEKFPEMTASDDAKLAELAGLRIKLITGARRLMKITHADDLDDVARYLRPNTDTKTEPKMLETRMGMGFDVHRFADESAGRKLMLCGVDVPSPRGLEGHSDADVGLHALTDAILGALAAGDIGTYFPPSDPTWRNADSALFLRHAAQMVTKRGGRIINVDVTIICEAPRIGPHRAAMVARMAEILGIENDRVSVKATTTEQLGFTGRGEGIAANAVAVIAATGCTD